MTKIIPYFFLIFINCLVSVNASPGVYACQDTHSSGLEWKGGRWQNQNYFADRKFFLKIEGDRITPDSARSAGGLGARTICHGAYQTASHGTIFTCDDYSDKLVFNPAAGAGARSALFGSISHRGNERDSVAVTTFVCQKM
jgi:hypothetical protein